MAENTKIEWATHTFNPWEGCQKVGPGCDHCYAETRNARYNKGSAPNWGPGAPRRRTSPANWRKPLKWNREAAGQVERPRVFCASLADVFDNAVDPEWRADLFELIRITPNLDWLLLTKRIGNVSAMVDRDGAIADNGARYLPANVWLGATVVNQEEADRDIPKLLATKADLGARIVFLSCEPLLGPVDLRKLRPDGINFTLDALTGKGEHLLGYRGQTGKIDWVIVGGESGRNARPMHPNWARSLHNQCAGAGVAFFMKQWGEWLPLSAHFPGFRADAVHIDGRKLTGSSVRQDGDVIFARVGKKVAGRLLAGIEHNEVPA